MQRQEVIFDPGFQVQGPSTPPDFPAVPSAYYYYLTPDEVKVSLLNNVGTPQEQQESLKIWYSLKSKALFPLNTAYAQFRDEQLIETSPPGSEIALSIKGGLRQIPSMADWFFVDQYTLILSQRKNPDMAEFHELIYQFPFNPKADGPQAGLILEKYLETGDETPIRNYFLEHGAVHLKDHPLGYYPVNELLFLMTRFASYPFNEYQLRLCQRRVQTQFKSPERTFIDAVFYEKRLEIGAVLDLIDLIQSVGPAQAGHKYGTNHKHWVYWANEYLNPTPTVPIENLAGPLSDVADKLFTWTDFQIDALLERLKVTPPFEYEFPARYAYVSSVAGTIKRYRADPETLARWLLETQPDLLGMGSVS